MDSKYYGYRRFLVRMFYLVIALLVTSCDSAPESPLKIGTNNWLGYETLYLARSLGLYEGTQVKLVELPSATEVIHALRNGTLHGATLTLDETLTLLADGFDMKVILVMDYSEGGDALLAKPEIRSLAGLRGKRVAVEYTAVGALLLDSALDEIGMIAADIEIVGCTFDDHLDCYKSVDAVVTFEPIRTKLLNQGARLLFDSSQIPGQIMDILVVNTETTITHPQSLKRLLAGHFKAREYLATEFADASKRMAARMGLTPAEVLVAYKGLRSPGLKENQALLNGNPTTLHQTANDLAEFMYNRGLLKDRLAIQHLADGRFLAGNTP